MIIINLFILLIPKAALGWNTLNSLICCMQELPEWLQIILLLRNTGLDFLLKSLLLVYVGIILLRWEHTFYMGVYDI